jgi:hypothetical protein
MNLGFWETRRWRAKGIGQPDVAANRKRLLIKWLRPGIVSFDKPIFTRHTVEFDPPEVIHLLWIPTAAGPWPA